MAETLRKNVRYKSPEYTGIWKAEPGTSGGLERTDKLSVERWVRKNTLGTTTEGYVARREEERDDNEYMETSRRGFLFFDGQVLGKIRVEIDHADMAGTIQTRKISYNVIVDIALSPSDAKIPRSLERIFDSEGFKSVQNSQL